MSKFAFNCDNGKRVGVCPSQVRLGELKLEPIRKQRQLNVLVVEDLEPLMRSIQRRLGAKGCSTVGAGTIPEALRIARSGQEFDAITLDFDLGNGTNGTQVFWELPETLKGKVVFFTGETDEKNLALIEKTGRPVVPKPEIELLIKAVREIAGYTE